MAKFNGKEIIGFLSKGPVQELNYTIKEFKIDENGHLIGILMSGDVIDYGRVKAQDELPSVTEADAGKFLMVDSTGAWVPTAIPIAEEDSF